MASMDKIKIEFPTLNRITATETACQTEQHTYMNS